MHSLHFEMQRIVTRLSLFMRPFRLTIAGRTDHIVTRFSRYNFHIFKNTPSLFGYLGSLLFVRRFDTKSGGGGGRIRRRLHTTRGVFQ